MTKPALVLIVLCVLVGALFGINSMSKGPPEREEVITKTDEGQVIYALKAIPKGSKISLTALQEKSIERWKIPNNAVPTLSIAAGQEARNDISSGQIILMSDLNSRPSGSTRIDNSAAPR
jgi:flagella basal body P-ring formation protein FlgA